MKCKPFALLMRDYDSVWTLREVGAHRLLFSRTLTILALANCRNEKFADFLITLKGNIQQTANVNCSLIEAIIVNTMKTLKIIVVLMWILRWNFQNLISINAHNALHTVCVIQRNSRFEVECLCVCVSVYAERTRNYLNNKFQHSFSRQLHIL